PRMALLQRAVFPLCGWPAPVQPALAAGALQQDRAGGALLVSDAGAGTHVASLAEHGHRADCPGTLPAKRLLTAALRCCLLWYALRKWAAPCHPGEGVRCARRQR